MSVFGPNLRFTETGFAHIDDRPFILNQPFELYPRHQEYVYGTVPLKPSKSWWDERYAHMEEEPIIPKPEPEFKVKFDPTPLVLEWMPDRVTLCHPPKSRYGSLDD